MKQRYFLKHLEWDSNFFGFKVGQLVIQTPEIISAKDVTEIISGAKAGSYRLIYIKSAEDELESIFSKEAPLFLADKKVTFGQDLKNYKELLAPSDNVRLYKSHKVNKKLIDLTLQSGVFSRFAIDPNFKNNEFEKLYTEWIIKSVSGEMAKYVWIYENESREICGMLTLGEQNGIADIGLLAVDTNYRGNNIGKLLVDAALKKSILWGKDKIQVVTQLNNHIACRFYKSCGFSIVKTDFIYHLWIK